MDHSRTLNPVTFNIPLLSTCSEVTGWEDRGSAHATGEHGNHSQLLGSPQTTLSTWMGCLLPCETPLRAHQKNLDNNTPPEYSEAILETHSQHLSRVLQESFPKAKDTIPCIAPLPAKP